MGTYINLYSIAPDNIIHTINRWRVFYREEIRLISLAICGNDLEAVGI